MKRRAFDLSDVRHLIGGLKMNWHIAGYLLTWEINDHIWMKKFGTLKEAEGHACLLGLEDNTWAINPIVNLEEKAND